MDNTKKEPEKQKSVVEMSIDELLHVNKDWVKQIMPEFDKLTNAIIEKTHSFNTLDAIRGAIVAGLVHNDAEMAFFCLYAGYRAGMMKEGQDKTKILVPGKDFE